MLFHVLTHVELNQGVLVVEQELRQRLGQLGLADSRRTEEDEGPSGTLRILQPRAGAANRATQRNDRLILANNALVEFVFHAQQLRRLFFGQAIHRNAGPVGEDLGDGLLVDEIEGGAARRLGRRVEEVTLGDEFSFLLFERFGLL